MYAETVPRSYRGMMLCYEILTFMFCVAVAINLDYPDPGCGDYDNKVECEDDTKAVKLASSAAVKAIWDTEARRHVLEPVCEWRLCSKSCEIIGAAGQPPAHLSVSKKQETPARVRLAFSLSL